MNDLSTFHSSQQKKKCLSLTQSNLFSPNEETKAVTPLGRPKGQIRPGDVEEMVRCDPGMDSSDPNINVWAVDSFTLRMLPQQKPDS